MGVTRCMPGDFESHSALILGCGDLFPEAPELMVRLIGALAERIPLLVMVHDEAQRRNLITMLCDWGVPAHLIYCVAMPGRGTWIRDYGPSFVQIDGKTVILDADYVLHNRVADDKVPSELAELLRLPVVRVPVAIEGGNLLSNGQGLILTTQRVLWRNEERGQNADVVRDALITYYGMKECVLLRPLLSEATGHIDMFATFVKPDTVVVGSYDPKIDPVNSGVLDANARILAGIQTPTGPLKVVRIPMPSNRGSFFRTFTNVIFANGTLIVPTYGREYDKEEQALATYRSLLPDWEVVGINAASMIHKNGVFRCMSLNVPWLEDRFGMVPARPIRQGIRVA